VAEKVLAAVRTAPSKTEILEYPMPEIADDAALMKMEVAGICGTDVRLYQEPPMKDPCIMGTRTSATSPRPAASSPAARASRRATSSSSSTT